MSRCININKNDDDHVGSENEHKGIKFRSQKSPLVQTVTQVGEQNSRDIDLGYRGL